MAADARVSHMWEAPMAWVRVIAISKVARATVPTPLDRTLMLVDYEWRTVELRRALAARLPAQRE